MQHGTCLQKFSQAGLLLMLLGGCSGQLSQEGAISPARKLTSRGGVYHQVRPGQTLWSIAHAYNADMQLLRQTNRLPDNDVLYVGSKLYIPGAKEARDVVSRCPCLVSALEDGDRFTNPPPAPSGDSPVSIAPNDRASIDTVRFVWPLFGEVKRGTDQDETRRHHGITIYAPQGTPVQAAADGDVMFSGWGPAGYGQMVILRHQAGLVTIYAHNDTNVVHSGERVRQGDQVAVVGRSGRLQEDSLHFEIRQNTVPVPPEKLLPSRSQNTVLLRQSN